MMSPLSCKIQSWSRYDMPTWRGRVHLRRLGSQALQQKRRAAPGITITGFTAEEERCQQPAILSAANSGGESTDILACDCSALVMAAEGSTDASVGACAGGVLYAFRIDERPTIELTFDQPQDHC